MCDKSDAENKFEAIRKGAFKGWVISNCKYCKKEYAQQKSRVWRDKYCSKKCRQDLVEERQSKRIVNCKRCGKQFLARSSQIADGNVPYCSISCGSKSQERTKERYEKVAKSIKKNISKHKYKKGSEVHNWNGGITKNVFGYIVQRVNGKQVLQHRYFMELHLGRKLKDSEIVHHINEIKDDNRIENLQIMTRAEHAAHHASERCENGRFK